MFVPINLINGGIVPSTNGANLKFNTNAGYIYGLGINFTNDTLQPNALYVPGTNPCTFQYRTQTGTQSGFTNRTTIDPNNYDVNGVVTSVPGSGNYTTQRIYLFPTGLVRIQYGQEYYPTLAKAVAAIPSEVFVVYPNNYTNGILTFDKVYSSKSNIIKYN